MKFIGFAVLLLLFFGVGIKEVSADVYINEVLPDPSGEENQDEWVELYNSGPDSVELNGFVLKDAADHQMTIDVTKVDGVTLLGPAAWVVVYRRGDSYFSLNNSQDETISLFDTSDNLLNQFSYNDSEVDKSWGRIPDGGSVS